MNVLIIKLGATGDVVRTTPLIRRFDCPITWLTAPKNVPFLQNVSEKVHCVSWDRRDQVRLVKHDLVINLEDDLQTAQFVTTIKFRQLFGAYADSDNNLRYTRDSRGWFDLSLISAHGRREADRLKLQNRSSYQQLIFDGLGFSFAEERYLLPPAAETSLFGDVAIAPEAGPVWPMKNWAYYDLLRSKLEFQGLTVNMLPFRSSPLEHLCDVRNHYCLVGGDSLPMHLALGAGTRCITLFTCTSPWEIYDYGVQTKIVSPLLEEFFYKRGHDSRATRSIGVEEVFDAVLCQFPGISAAPTRGSRK